MGSSRACDGRALRERHDIHLAYREGKRPCGVQVSAISVEAEAASVTFRYGVFGVVSAWLYKLFLSRGLIVDTGDVIYE